MTTLYGTPPPTDAPQPAGTTPPLVIYARAAFFLPDEEGRRTLSDDLLVEVARRLKRGDGPLDVVLVTDDAALVLVSRLPMGLSLAGVVAEKPWQDAEGGANRIAVVAGVPGLDTTITEGDLLIVDAEKARVLVEPDAEEFVRLQTERHRARVLLGAAHTFAHTQAGRVVPVWASVQNARDVQDALEAGADGMVLEPGGDLLDDSPVITGDENPFPEPVGQMSLLSVVEAIGGGPVGLNVPFGLLDPVLVLTLAGASQLRWAVAPDNLPLPLPELRRELSLLLRNGAAAEGEETDGESGEAVAALRAVPLFAALATNAGGEEAADLAAFDEVWLLPDVLENLTLGEVYALPPVRVLLGDALDVLPELLALGVHGIVVVPALVGVTKDMIRQQPN